MRMHLLGIDHVVVAVRDLDRAEDIWSRLGFSLTPRGFHTLGSQNHCLMFGSGYLELLAVPMSHPATRHFSEFLDAGDGMAAIALATDDARAAHAELTAAGFDPAAPVDFSRPVNLPEGTRDAAFRIVHLPPSATPGFRSFLCEHFTREVVWRTETMTHALGVSGLAGVCVVSADAELTARTYARLFDVEPVPISEGWRVDTGNASTAVPISAPVAAPIAASIAVSISIATPERLAMRLADVVLPQRQSPVLAALFLHVADRAVAVSVLRRGGFNPRQLADGSIAIGADQANGVALVFG